MRHTFSETWSGLRRHLTMTVAVVVTMWVSLSLFGIGLLANQQVDLMKGNWYDKIEISVFLCTKDTRGDNCEPGQDITAAQRQAIEDTLRGNPEVQEVYYETKEQAYAEFRKAYEGNPLQDSLTVDQMQESFRVKLTDPETYQGVVSAVIGLPGVQAVQDLHQVLDSLFEWLGVVQWATIIASVLLLVAASLQIGNTIRMAAFARRREIGIMRLVGASNLHIMLPFLLEAIISAFLGIVLASVTLAATVYFIIIQKAEVLIQASPWIGWQHAALAMLGVAIVGLLLAIIPTLIATRKYLKV